MFLPALIRADTVSLGIFSLNTLIPGVPGSPGVNDFAIDNLSGSFSLLPDFPASDPLTFMNSSVVLTLQGGSQQTITLGNLGSGSFTPASLQFSASTSFTSAIFTATLNPTSFSLGGGSSFQAASPQLSVILSPSSGAVLSPGVDFARISVTSSVPEPHPGLLVLTGFAAAIWLRKRYGSQI